MKKIYLLMLIASLFMSGCDVSIPDGDSGNTTDDSPTVKNVALSTNGGSATGSVNASSAGNAIDGNEGTAWSSIDGSTLVVDFGGSKKVTSITIKKSDGLSISSGSNPDVLVELSSDNTTYYTSNITKIFGGDISCTSTSLSSSRLYCAMSAYSARYIKITTQNGKAFDFSEVDIQGY